MPGSLAADSMQTARSGSEGETAIRAPLSPAGGRGERLAAFSRSHRASAAETSSKHGCPQVSETIGGCTRVGCRQFGWGRNGGLTASVRIPVCAVRVESPGLPPAGGQTTALPVTRRVQPRRPCAPVPRRDHVTTAAVGSGGFKPSVTKHTATSKASHGGCSFAGAAPSVREEGARGYDATAIFGAVNRGNP